MACLGPHSKVTGTERKREIQTWGCAFIEVDGWVPRILQIHSLLVNLKHKRGR